MSILPTIIRIRDGQKVNIAKIPGSIALPALIIPNASNLIIINNGPEPTINKINPIFNSYMKLTPF